MGNDETSGLDEVPESFTRSAALAWRVLGGAAHASETLVEVLDTELAELAAGDEHGDEDAFFERILAIAILSPLSLPHPGADVGAGFERPERPDKVDKIGGERAAALEEAFDLALGRLSVMVRSRFLLGLVGPPASSLGGEDTPHETAASLTESLWGDWLGAPAERRFILALMWSLMGRLPLAIDNAELVLELAQGVPLSTPRRTAEVDGVAWLSRATPKAEVEHEPLVAFAVGRAAALGDPGARLLLRDLLAGAVASRTTGLLLLAGLGAGRPGVGLSRLCRLARVALTDELLWAKAVLGAVFALGAHASGPRLLAVGGVLEALSLMRDQDDCAALMAALPDLVRREVYRAVARDFERCSPPLRAALSQALLSGRLDGPDERPEAPPALLRERSPEVLLLVLGLLERVGDAVPRELKAALGRMCSDHPDVAVRRALARAMPLKVKGEGKGLRPEGDVVALPPRALARDDLDRLRAAIWAGESEKVVELASCVPLDRRLPARESILTALEVPNAPLRRSLVEAIGRIGGQADAPRLLEAARRYRALEGTVAAALRALNAKTMAEPLAEIYRRRLKWADDDAVDDYCAIAGPEQVVYLRDALETRFYPSARSGAARAIARHKAHEVVFALRAAALSDAQEPSRLAALSALMELTGTSPSAGEIAGYALLFKPTDELEDAIERAREAGPSALPGLRRTLMRGSWKRRRAACEVLAGIAGDESQAVLMGAIEDPDEDVRLAALEALVQRGWEPRDARERTLQALAARRLRELALDPVDLDRETLVGALSLGGHVFRAEILELLTALDIPVSDEELGLIAAARGDVAAAARRTGGLTAVMRAADHTWQATPHRACFVRGLTEISAFAVADALSGSHSDWSWRAREAQAQALFRFSPARADRREPELATARAIERLAELTHEDDDDVRRAALTSLALIGTEQAAEAIATGLVSPFQEDRDLVARALGKVGPAALPVLDRLIGEPWWECRQGAATALAQWRTEVQTAVDRLIVLAVDAEYRVAQSAREALSLHGLLPTTGAVVRAIEHAQTLTVEGLEPWLGLHRTPSAIPEIAHALDVMIERTPADALPQRLGLIALFRAEHLALWLEQVALGVAPTPPASSEPTVETSAAPHRHLGCRLAAADALRALSRRVCTVCQGERTVRCPGCAGAGDTPCPACGGKGQVMVKCPDPGCTAHGTLRRIDSPRCPTCRGRGEVQVACSCERGRTPCGLCEAMGRLTCAACEGTGDATYE